MPPDDLIISILNNIKDDVREIRDIQKEQGSKISDLCTRTALNEKDIHNVIEEQVNKSTLKFKIISTIFGVIGASSTIFSYLKH